MNERESRMLASRRLEALEPQLDETRKPTELFEEVLDLIRKDYGIAIKGSLDGLLRESTSRSWVLRGLALIWILSNDCKHAIAKVAACIVHNPRL